MFEQKRQKPHWWSQKNWWSNKKNSKQKRQKTADKKKSGFGQTFTEDAQQFKIVNHILCDLNKSLDSVCFEPADISILHQQMEEENSEKEKKNKKGKQQKGRVMSLSLKMVGKKCFFL